MIKWAPPAATTTVKIILTHKGIGNNKNKYKIVYITIKGGIFLLYIEYLLSLNDCIANLLL